MLNCCAIRKPSHQLRRTRGQQCCGSIAKVPSVQRRERSQISKRSVCPDAVRAAGSTAPLPSCGDAGRCTAVPHLVKIPASASTSLWQTFHTANLKNCPQTFFFSPIIFIWTIPSIFSPYYLISGLCPPLLFILLLPATVFLPSPLPPADTTVYLFLCCADSISFSCACWPLLH